METAAKDALPCRSVSPEHKFACMKADHHNRTEEQPLHRNGAVVWENGAPKELTISLVQAIHDTAAEARKLQFGPPLSVTFKQKGRPPVDLSDMVSMIEVGADEEMGMTSFPPERTTNPAEDTELGRWWMATAENEVDLVVPKAIEYGSTDLIDIGRNIARLSGRTVTDAEAAELGVFFYLEGKFARWRSAIIEGRPVSDDTLHDIGVYVRMTQRIRYKGGWPGVDL